MDPVGVSGALALWWVDTIQVNILFSSPHILHTRINSGDLASPTYITFIYGPTDEGLRSLCWQEVRRIGRNIDESWLCLRDFNDILSQSEKSGGRDRAWR